MDWRNWAVCHLIWASRGHNNKSAATALQAKLPGRRGFSASSIQRNAALARKAPPDVIEVLRELPVQPKYEEGAEIVRLGLEAVERGPIVDPDALAASLQAKLPIAGPDAIAAAVTAKMVESDELVAEVVAGIIAQQADSSADASRAVAGALAQAPKPPSTDEIAAKVEATLAQHPKKIARYVARYLGRRLAKQSEALNTKHLGDEIAQKVSEKVPAPKVDEAKIAAAVVRGLLPWFGVGLAGLLAVVWIFLYLPSQHLATERMPDDRFTGAFGEDTVRRPLALGQSRLPLLDGQEHPPCQEPSHEQDGGCWFVLEDKPPCGKSWEKGGKCWIPVMVGKRRPPQSGDGKQASPPAEVPR